MTVKIYAAHLTGSFTKGIINDSYEHPQPSLSFTRKENVPNARKGI
jgi:hypothetical protein